MKIRKTKQKEKPGDSSHAAVVRNLSLVSVIGNTALSGFKLFAGVTGNSGAMISDSIHSFSDVFTTLIAWIGVKLSEKEADREHPYGHERMECAASLILGIILMGSGLWAGKIGVEHILSGDYRTAVPPGRIALLAAVVSIAVKEAMFWYTQYYAKRIHSAAFCADAWHHRSDALSSVGSLAGIAGARMGLPVLDSVASTVICLFIVKVAYDILKEAFAGMLDTSCSEEYEQKIRKRISEQNGVLQVDMLRSRKFGNRVYIDLEIAVDGEKSLWEAHEVAERIHEDVERNFSDIKHIMIHVNPLVKTV